MRLDFRCLCFVVMLVPFFGACQQKEPNYETIIYNDGTEEIVKKPTITSGIPNGKEVTILPSEWMQFYNDCNEIDHVANYYVEGSEISQPVSFVVRWSNTNPICQYTFLLADNKEMVNPVSYDVDSTYISLEDLFAGTHYYYQIKATYEDKTVISQRFDFKTVDFFRTIRIDGVLNARDLGNKKTKDGKKRVKQGLIYRTANFDSVTTAGKRRAIEKYHIKTDLDLREQGPTSSPLGPDVQYINNGVGEYGSPHYVSSTYGINVAEYQVAMRDNLKVLANKDNYPLAFHCAVGRDRTGTLAVTLYLLLGIDLSQIEQDYVVSFFSKACNSVSFDSYLGSLGYLIQYFKRYKGGATSDDIDVYQRAENYCLHIGLSKDEISSIRSILLEDIQK